MLVFIWPETPNGSTFSPAGLANHHVTLISLDLVSVNGHKFGMVIKRLVVGISAFIFILCGLYPPWVSPGGFKSGYRSLFDLPPSFQSHVDMRRLFVEWVVVVVTAGVVVWMLPKKRKPPTDAELDKARQVMREQGEQGWELIK